jgi:uncharacterized membrane protein HdeD (DUF308 family)
VLRRHDRRLDNAVKLAQFSIVTGGQAEARGIEMAQVLIGNWWLLAIRGVFAIIFAVIAFVWPGITVTVLVLMFGAYALVDGIFALAAALRAARHHGRSGALLLEGILDLIIAGIVFFWPVEALVAIIYFIAIWAVITGIALIAAGIAMIRINGEWLLVLSGIISILLGIILFVQPGAGALALSWWLGIYALLFGISLIGAAFRLRHWHPA